MFRPWEDHQIRVRASRDRLQVAGMRDSPPQSLAFRDTEAEIRERAWSGRPRAEAYRRRTFRERQASSAEWDRRRHIYQRPETVGPRVRDFQIERES